MIGGCLPTGYGPSIDHAAAMGGQGYRLLEIRCKLNCVQLAVMGG
jgi:hypothetical protein